MFKPNILYVKSWLHTNEGALSTVVNSGEELDISKMKIEASEISPEEI